MESEKQNFISRSSEHFFPWSSWLAVQASHNVREFFPSLPAAKRFSNAPCCTLHSLDAVDYHEHWVVLIQFWHQFCYFLEIMLLKTIYIIIPCYHNLKSYHSSSVSTQSHWIWFCSEEFSMLQLLGATLLSLLLHTYLARRSTVIMKAVPPGRGSSIALRLGWPLRLPQMWATR